MATISSHTDSESATPLMVKCSLVFICLGAASFAQRDGILFGLGVVFAVVSRLNSRGSIAIPWPGLVLVTFLAAYRMSDGGHITPTLLTIITGVFAYVACANITTAGGPYLRTLGAIVGGMTAHASMNLFLILRDHGLRPDTRIFDDVWTGAPSVATAHAALWTPLIGLLPLFLILRRRRPWVALGLSATAAAILAASLLASRTLVLLLALLIVGFVVLSRFIVADRVRLSRTSTAALSISAIVGAVLAWTTPGALANLPLFHRFASSETTLGDDPRIGRWLEYSTRGWSHFYGGGHLRAEMGFGHNLWLDVLDMAGVPAFLLITVFFLAYLFQTLRLARGRFFTVEEKVASAGLALACLTHAATEPLLEGMPSLFIAMCGFAGATAAAVADRMTPNPSEQTDSAGNGRGQLARR